MKIQHLNKRKIVFFSVASFVLIFFGVLMYFNSNIVKTPLRPVNGAQFYKATVTEVISSDVSQSPSGELEGNQEVKLKITSGKFAGHEVTAQSPHANNAGAYCVPGLKVIALVNENTIGQLTASVYNYDRGMTLWLLAAVFFCLLCVIGGKKGVTSSLALIFTLVCIIFFYIPLMYVGTAPFLAASISALLITMVSMLLVGGWCKKTFCAIVGTAAGVLAAGFTAMIFGAVGHISGLNVSEMETMAYISQKSRLDVGGILFSGILISSLGAVLDVSMSVASTIVEIHTMNPGIGKKQLFRSGINVGRDMMGTMSSTLILAYAGSSVNTLVIIYAYSMTYLQVMNGYEIGIEILSGLSGSIGVILTVPFVSLLSSIVLTRLPKGAETTK